MNWVLLNNMSRLILESFRFGESYSEGVPAMLHASTQETPRGRIPYFVGGGDPEGTELIFISLFYGC